MHLALVTWDLPGLTARELSGRAPGVPCGAGVIPPGMVPSPQVKSLVATKAARWGQPRKVTSLECQGGRTPRHSTNKEAKRRHIPTKDLYATVDGDNGAGHEERMWLDADERQGAVRES